MKYKDLIEYKYYLMSNEEKNNRLNVVLKLCFNDHVIISMERI